MTDNIRKFFLGLKNPNYLAMKLLLDVFEQMQGADDVSKSIVDDIGVLSQYNISLVDSCSMYNFVYTEDDFSEVKFAISRACHEYIVCHEFGHLLLDLFYQGDVPEEYMEVNAKAVKRIMDNRAGISNMLKRFSSELYQDLVDNVGEATNFIEKHSEVYKQYCEKNGDVSYEAFINDVIADYYCFSANLDKKAINYNRVGNIVDSMFHGDNPFYELYGNAVFFPLVASHDKEYFTEDEHSPEFAGFEEQFADYLVLRLYGGEMPGVVNTVRNIAGDEWFLMMDKVYEGIAGRMAEKGKVYQYK